MFEFEYFIWGSDEYGNHYPREHGMSSLCAQATIDSYRKKYPMVCHINLDMALDMETVPFMET